MNTQELAEKIAENQNISKADARKLVDSVIAAISDAAAAGEEVNINGFGKFSVKSTPARTGRNPRTGEAQEIEIGRASCRERVCQKVEISVDDDSSQKKKYKKQV